MPRGYLKHDKNINHKSARGGSSHSNKNRNDMPSPPHPMYKKEREQHDDIDDFVNYPPKEMKVKSENYQKSTTLVTSYPISECIICFERYPIISLSTKCDWHGGACYQCLRQLYIKQEDKVNADW
eukprot:CAMPEP_0194133176 /NCGR_PEP_ID=MMETSP0152-20130528/3458_1 /TAXON_ID=1049557 /ORGANISM="Thalassiothrix antarctica, Strain L6-D1" /LENGTH=124 /DNA_ID=CAMNT_0038828443 /DNA_START=38 /DNA_END=409 /DNA_ORIENTATION=-